MFGLLKKKTCSMCGADKKTTKIIVFDPTNRGEFPEMGEKKLLCIDHVEENWKRELENFKGRAVCYLPEKGWNSYSYIPLDRAEEWNIEPNEISALSNIINTHHKQCKECNKDGKFMLFDCSYDGQKISKDDKTTQILCGKHFVDAIVLEIKSKDLKIDEINTPFGDKGLYMQGEF